LVSAAPHPTSKFVPYSYIHLSDLSTSRSNDALSHSPPASDDDREGGLRRSCPRASSLVEMGGSDKVQPARRPMHERLAGAPVSSC
jgi:hypothetical protein